METKWLDFFIYTSSILNGWSWSDLFRRIINYRFTLNQFSHDLVDTQRLGQKQFNTIHTPAQTSQIIRNINNITGVSFELRKYQRLHSLSSNDWRRKNYKMESLWLFSFLKIKIKNNILKTSLRYFYCCSD